MEKVVNEQPNQGKQDKDKKDYVNPVIAWGSIIAELVIVGVVALIVALV